MTTVQLAAAAAQGVEPSATAPSADFSVGRVIILIVFAIALLVAIILSLRANQADKRRLEEMLRRGL